MEDSKYFKFTSKSRLDLSINTLLGIMQGITIDSEINQKEISFLQLWLNEHNEVKHLHPFNEIWPRVIDTLNSRIIDNNERDNLVWLCEKIRSKEYYNQITTDLQLLHGILGGIASDGLITEVELGNLSIWLQRHEHLKLCWPYDEIYSLVNSALSDQKIDVIEHAQLIQFFSEFTSILDDRTITNPSVNLKNTIQGVCSIAPDIQFRDKTFCFTGTSSRYKRKELEEIVTNLGGIFSDTVNLKVDYLIIGSEGNNCWSYACYGRKVEKAVELRKQGHQIQIIHENSFHETIEN